jgi:hypothetical protein
MTEREDKNKDEEGTIKVKVKVNGKEKINGG